VFDFGGVIANMDEDKIVRFLSSHLEISNAQAQDLLKEFNTQQKRGGDAEVFWRTYFLNHGLAWKREWIENLEGVMSCALTPNMAMIAIVQNLQMQWIRTAMLSNTTALHASAIRKRGLYRYFSPLLLSYEIGVSKPDPLAFQILLSSLDKPASACLFIDDKLTNVKAAVALGIDSIQFHSAKQVQMELSQRGIRVSLHPPYR